MEKTYLVKGIQFNGGKPFKVTMPVVCDLPSIAKSYLRHYVIDYVGYEFEYYKELPCEASPTTYFDEWQLFEFDAMETLEETCEFTREYEVEVLHTSNMIVTVNDHVYEMYGGDIESCIHHCVSHNLPIDFVVTKK